MEPLYYTIEQVVEKNIQASVKATSAAITKRWLLGILAGFFVAFGAQGSSLVMHGISDVGVARALAGTVFPLGLMLIVLLGGDLFTGKCLISMAVFSKKITWQKMSKSLLLIYVSNFLGAVLMAWMINRCGQLHYSEGRAGAYTIKVALGKALVDPSEAFISGILCNVLVCLAIFMAAAAKDIAGKCLGIFFPIFVFVISGFEHCIANMFYIPAGIFASQNADYVDKATKLYGITGEQLSSLNWAGLVRNLIPVTLGNIVGGVVFVGLVYWYLYEKKE